MKIVVRTTSNYPAAFTGGGRGSALVLATITTDTKPTHDNVDALEQTDDIQNKIQLLRRSLMLKDLLLVPCLFVTNKSRSRTKMLFSTLYYLQYLLVARAIIVGSSTPFYCLDLGIGVSHHRRRLPPLGSEMVQNFA